MRGDVFRLRRPRDAQGHEQQNERFAAVVVQATRLLHLSTWVVAPTSTRARPFVFRPQVELPLGSQPPHFHRESASRHPTTPAQCGQTNPSGQRSQSR